MRLDGQRESANVEDRRGMSPMMRGGGLGCGGLIIVLVLAWLTGMDPRQLLQTADQVVPQQQSNEPQGQVGAPADQLGKFASQVLASTEDVWETVFSANGRTYEKPRLVLFSGRVGSACGMASSASGPFYCPLDRQVYIDLSFFEEMTRRFGAPGDFAQAYVIAHEIGHHVQNLLGVAEQIQNAQERSRSQEEANQYSVQMELQADCLAGVWGAHAQRAGIIETGDFEEGLSAASAIGDDRLQKMGQGYVAPESFTHGSSAQRVEWLRKGLASGDPNACEL
jgi:uncharacterized protein